MAIDVCHSEISALSGIVSPRLSFSYDLNPGDDADHQTGRLDSSLHDSSSDFDFCVDLSSSVAGVSSADELFSNGKILPVQIKNRGSDPTVKILRPCAEKSRTAEKKRLKDLLLMNLDSDLDDDGDDNGTKARPSKSFWQFKRSLSLNQEGTRARSLVRSLPFLSRSNSTGSAPNPKPNLLPKESRRTQRRSLHGQPSVSRRSSASGSGFSSSHGSTPKPLPKKSFGSHYSNGGYNGVRVSPVLNFPPPSFISGASAGFLGFLCNGKTKRKNR